MIDECTEFSCPVYLVCMTVRPSVAGADSYQYIDRCLSCGRDFMIHFEDFSKLTNEGGNVNWDQLFCVPENVHCGVTRDNMGLQYKCNDCCAKAPSTVLDKLPADFGSA